MYDLTDKMNFFEGHTNNGILRSREPGETYGRAVTRKEYAVYFPEDGEVELDLSASKDSLRWFGLFSVPQSGPLRNLWVKEIFLLLLRIRVIG